MHIHISIQRPYLTACLVIGAIALIFHVTNPKLAADIGGQASPEAVAHAYQDIDRERIRQPVLAESQKICRKTPAQIVIGR